jgi:hypothetical protein
VTLSNDAVLKFFKNYFVCGFKNIKDEPYCGRSGDHDPDSPAVLTTNGAGQHNVQLFVLSADGTVVHCLPGFWTPQDLMFEMRFALRLHKLCNDPNLTPEARRKLFRQAQLANVRTHPTDMMLRSHLQNFDAKAELKKKDSDFRYRAGDYRPPLPAVKGFKHPELKTVDQVIHVRMAERPFLAYERFDVATFVEWGIRRYDKHENDPARMKKKKT